MNKCLLCNLETNNEKYCSRSCAAKVNNSVKPKRIKKLANFCVNCGDSTYNQKYCTNECQHNYRKDNKIDKWLNGDRNAATTSTGNLSYTMRAWLLDRADHKCEKCKWGKIHPLTGRPPLEIDHINGDPKDHRLQNLQVLCPNCHSLEPTSKALNSKVSRKKYGLNVLEREHSRPERTERNRSKSK